MYSLVIKVTLLTILSITLSCQSNSNQSRKKTDSTEFIKQEAQISDTLKTVLEDAYASALEMKGLRSLIVIKGDKIVAESYFAGYSGDSLDHVRSVTKSVLGTLVGIAVDQGLIKSIDDPISDYLSDHKLSTRQKKITIRHLLNMAGGMDWDGSIEEFNRWVSGGNHVRKTLGNKVIETPGSRFNYNVGDPYIMSMILTEAAGMSVNAYAEKYLFKPLGIKNYRWERLSGYINGNAGLEISPGTMAKLGLMYKNGGLYQGKQILSETWVDQVSRIQMSLYESGDEESGYGLYWWSARYKNHRFFMAKGFAGQNIAVIPVLDMVIVTTCEWLNLSGRSAQQSEQAHDLVTKQIAQKYYKKLFPD